jgi:hypothetical protein
LVEAALGWLIDTGGRVPETLGAARFEGVAMGVGYLVQGLRGNTLVAGKTAALRLVTAPWPAEGAAAVQATVVRPDGSLADLVWSSTQLVVVDPGGSDESVVVLIPGRMLPDVGVYYVRALALTAVGSVAATYLLDGVEFFPTKDLRMKVNRIWSGTGPAAKPGEMEAATQAMQRLAALYPVRDGISTLDGDYSAGLRYDFDNNPEGPPNQDGNLGPSWDSYQNPAPEHDRLDAALAYRLPDVGEGSGAITRSPYNGWLPWSVIVWLAPIPQVFCHETGHNHGLESPNSPHFDPTGQASHSKDLTIDPADAGGGFDIQFNQPFPVPTYDIMFPTGPAPGYTPDQVSLNSWDWEFVRQQLLKRSSTGPTGPFIRWQRLGGHDLTGPPCAARNRDGRLEVFALGADRALYHIWEERPGGDWSGWSTLEGQELAPPLHISTDADGRSPSAATGGSTPERRSSQTVTGRRGFHSGENPPRAFRLPGTPTADSNSSPSSVTALLTTCGNWAPVATGAAGRHSQATTYKARWRWPRTPTDAWKHSLSAATATSTTAGRSPPNGKTGWSDWANLIDPRLLRVTDLRAEQAGDGRIFVILMTADLSISYLAQSLPNGGWGPAVELYGHDLLWPCGLARADDGRLEVAVIGGDHQLYSRWQVDPARTDLWANWTPLGGRDIQPGVALAADHTGQLELFVIGGDGALYRGPRN